MEADSIAELYLCDDVFIPLRLRISGSARQLVEESETHAFLPSSLIRAIPRHPIACRARRIDRHKPDVPYLSQHRARSKARSRASYGNYRRRRDNPAIVADLEASSQRYGHSALIGRSRKALTVHRCLCTTWRLGSSKCRTGPWPAPSRRHGGGAIGRSEHPPGRAGRATECCSPSLAHPPGSPVPLIPLWRDFQCTRGLAAVNLQCTRIIGLTNLSVTVLPHFSEFALYSPRRFSFNPKWPPDEESTRCKRNIEMIPLCNIEVTLPRVLGSREVPWRCCR